MHGQLARGLVSPEIPLRIVPRIHNWVMRTAGERITSAKKRFAVLTFTLMIVKPLLGSSVNLEEAFFVFVFAGIDIYIKRHYIYTTCKITGLDIYI